MNGEVIGTMEGSTELSHTDSPESSLKHDINDEDDPSLHKLSCTDQETGNHVDTNQETGNHVDTDQETGNHVDTDHETGNHVDTDQETGNHVDTDQETGNHVDTNQETGNHVDTDQETGNHVDTDQETGNHVDTDQETGNHVDEACEPTDEPDKIAKVVSNGITNHKPDNVTDEIFPPQQENISNTAKAHNSTTSNESCLDSATSEERSEIEGEGSYETNLKKECNITSISDERPDTNNEVPSQDIERSETVSIKSNTDVDEDDSSQDSKNNVKIEESSKLCPDGKNSNSNACSSPEVQEIATDIENCVKEKVESKPVKEIISPLRRSSRTIKRKRYDNEENGDDESDVEEVVVRDVRRKSKAIFTNNTKIEMALKQKFGHQKKENPIVIRDSYRETANRGSMMRKNPMALNNTALTAQNLYQSILARGTTVTPVSSKNPAVIPVNAKTPSFTPAISKNTSVTPASGKNPAGIPVSSKIPAGIPVTGKSAPQMQSSSQNMHSTPCIQPVILPSLTDDMFVVEAPSFIVPYVYEKPSIKPFREFVDELGKELAAQKAKEYELKKEKEAMEAQIENETLDTEIKDTKETSGDVEEVKAKAVIAKTEDIEEAKKKKDLKKARRRRKRDDEDDVSWDGESSTDSDDDLSDEEHAIVIKDKADPIEEIKDVTDMTVDKIVIGKSENNYFDMTLGKFFMDIGLNFVQEYVQNDLLKQQNRKLYKEKKGGHSTKATETSIAALMKNLEISKENNAPYKFKQHKCKFCSFKSESMLAMSHHLETPHMKNNVYRCNFCEFDSKSPQDILFHMDAVHNTRGRLERAPAYHQCANCPFEDNGKGKLARHLLACAKKFKPEFNLSPPIEWEPPAKIPKMAKARNQMLGSYQNSFNKGQNITNNFGRPPLSNLVSMTTIRPKGRLPMGVPPRTPVQGIPIVRGNMAGRQNNPTPVLMPGSNEKNSPVPKSMYQPSISITPLPRQPPPLQLPPPQLQGQQNKSSCVICEICDGYIKDLEQLRNHMQWIHKVKIHPKMIHNRPPLNCQKCQFRFFTDQGLERHLLGSHGLVTSSMQEAANKGKDGGRCPVCGRVYQWKLLNHVTRDHKLQLKPAHLSYKCTVCTATFGMYKQFENHVYSQHSVVAKRAMDKDKAPAQVKASPSLLKPLKINDEITIIPQPVKAAAEK